MTSKGEVEMNKKNRVILLFLLSVVFATTFALAINVTANAQGYGGDTAVAGDTSGGGGGGGAVAVTGGEMCGAAFDRNGDGLMDTWDRNVDGVMDAFDVNYDGTIDSMDLSISCAAVTTSSRLPLTGAPALAIAAIGAVLLGTGGYVLRRSRG
jgi:LPXTG-motif cell wall-anchored protein